MKVNIGPYPNDDETERVINIQIDEHDVWNLDNTLAHIIHPLLVEFAKNDIWHPPEIEEDEWKCALQKMITSFEMIKTCDSFHKQHEIDKIQEGLDLFAKYYLCLWN